MEHSESSPRSESFELDPQTRYVMLGTNTASLIMGMGHNAQEILSLITFVQRTTQQIDIGKSIEIFDKLRAASDNIHSAMAKVEQNVEAMAKLRDKFPRQRFPLALDRPPSVDDAGP